MVTENSNLTSIASYMIDKGNEVMEMNAYFHKMPEKVFLPAIYFPNPIVSLGSETLSSYSKNYMWFIKVLATSTEDAYQIAEYILTCIAGNRNKVPILNKDNTPTGNNINFDKTCSVKEIDANTYQISLSWTERFYFDDIVHDSVRYVYLTDDEENILHDDNGNILIDEFQSADVFISLSTKDNNH